jgi:hypothetical protein
MKIEITTNGSDYTVLCHGAERGAGKRTGPRIEEVAGTVGVQVLKYLRAARSVPVSRANLEGRWSFETSEQFSTLEAANEHAFAWPLGGCPRSGDLRITVAAQVRYLPDSVIEDIKCRIQGLTVHARYLVHSPQQTSSL